MSNRSIITALLTVLVFALFQAPGDAQEPLKLERPPKRDVSPAEAERRRQAFEEAMRKIEAAEKAREAEKKREEESAAAARAAQEALQRSIDEEAAAASKRLAQADETRAAAQGFASEVAEKVPDHLRGKFEQPPPVEPKEKPAPKPEPAEAPGRKASAEPEVVQPPRAPAAPPAAERRRQAPPSGGVPVKGNGPEPGPDPAPAVSEDADKGDETVIDSAKVIFDGSGRFGKEYQVVVFEEEVEVQNPEFRMNSDKLVAFFKRPEAEPEAAAAEVEGGAETSGAGEGTEEAEETGSQLERAVATGREVVVTKLIEGGEPQIAKARKATYFADREEVMLEVWPQVQRGKNLVIAKSKETVIILRGEEMIVKGPVRTTIVGKTKGEAIGESEDAPVATTPETRRGRNAEPEHTVIEAERGAVFNRPSATEGEKEVFFEGGVKVIDPGFDMIGGEDLTAYLKRDETTGDTFMRRAVMRGQRVEVTEKIGDRRRGSARAVTFLPESGDIRLAGYPEIIDGVQHKKLDSPTAVLALNKDTNEVRGRGGRATMTFTPNSRPPE